MKNSIVWSLLCLCFFNTEINAQTNNNSIINIQKPSKEISSSEFEGNTARMQDGQIVFIQSAAQNKGNLFLTLKENYAQTGTHLAVQEMNPIQEDNFKWKLIKRADWFSLQHQKSGLMLTIKDTQIKPGTIVWLEPLDQEKDAQKFKFQKFERDPSLHLIQAKYKQYASDLLLDLNSTLPRAGTQMVVNRREQGRRVQKWRFILTF